MRNVKLKAAIFKTDKRQREIAKRAGIPESYLSMATNGRMNLSEDQQRKVAAVLGVKVKEIFA